MDAGLIPTSPPAGSPPQEVGSKANIAPTNEGNGQAFARHMQEPLKGGQPVANQGLSQQLGNPEIKGNAASQGSVSLPETLMGKMQATALMQQVQSLEALGAEAIDLEKLKGLGQRFPDLEALLEQSPSLAFMTGRLEFVAADEIPGIVTSNKFIQSALAAGEVGEFMSSPRSIGNLIEELQLPSPVKGIISRLGMDLNQVVTPGKLLATLGLDPGIVSSELQMLKNSMQVDGLSPYMVRAEKLHKPRASHAMMKDPTLGQTTDKPLADHPEPAAAATTSAAMLTQDRQALKSQSRLQQQADSVPAYNEPKLAAPMGQISARPIDINQAGISQGEGFDATRFERVSQDPTQSIARVLEQMSADQKHNFSAASHNKQPEAIVKVNETGADSRMFADPQLTGQLAATQGDGQGLAQNQAKHLQALTMDRLMASQMQHLEGGGGLAGATNFGGESSDSGFKQSFGQEAELNLGIDQSRGSTLATAGSQKADFIETLRQSEVSPKTVHKEVIEKAQMLLKDGGGQIKMDFGSGENKVELALDIKNDTVNLKILTNSEQVKDLLANDLPKLREALGQQNLELKEVELGSHSKREWSNGSFDQGAFQKEFAEQQERFVQRPDVVVKSSSQSYGSLISTNAGMARPRHSGQIQVFA